MNDNLDDLQNKIRAAREGGVGESAPPQAQIHAAETKAEDVNNGLRAGTELVGAMIGGGLIGYGLDVWFETRPLLFIIFLLLGVFTGFWNIYRLINNMGSSVGFAQLHKDTKQAKETQVFKGTSEED